MRIKLIIPFILLLMTAGCVRGKQEMWLYSDGSAYMYQELAVAEEIATQDDFAPPFDDYSHSDSTIRNLKIGDFTKNNYVYYFAEYEIPDLEKFIRTSAKADSIAHLRLQRLSNNRLSLTQTLSEPSAVSPEDEETYRLLLAGEYLTMIVHVPHVLKTNGTTSTESNSTQVQWKVPMEDVLIDGVNRPLAVEYSLVKPSRGYIYFRNDCSKPIRLAISYMDKNKEWQHERWWYFNANQRSHLLYDDAYLSSNNKYFYLYAETTDKSNLVWKGDEVLDFGDVSLSTREITATQDSDGDWVLTTTCN